MPRSTGKGSPRTPKLRRCRDCHFSSGEKTLSTTCPRCGSVMRVIR